MLNKSNFRAKGIWIEICNGTKLENSDLIPCLTSRRQVLACQGRTTLNLLRTGLGRCGHQMFEWGMKDILNDCLKRKISGGIKSIMELTTEALHWLKYLEIKL